MEDESIQDFLNRTNPEVGARLEEAHQNTRRYLDFLEEFDTEALIDLLIIADERDVDPLKVAAERIVALEIMSEN